METTNVILDILTSLIPILIVLFSMIAFPVLLTTTGLLLPARVEQCRQKMETSPSKCFLIGLIYLSFWFLSSTIYLVWVVKASLEADVFFSSLRNLLVVVIFLPGLPALATIAQIIGTRSGEAKTPFQRDLRGSVLLMLSCFAPFIGWFIFTPIVISFALGAGWLAMFQRKAIA